ncbi:MAG: hypothetical protein K2X01_08180 [Cyanobacteria bacterium]|nr:hypothetical protein [Cyanobacteriota bacterium]
MSLPKHLNPAPWHHQWTEVDELHSISRIETTHHLGHTVEHDDIREDIKAINEAAHHASLIGLDRAYHLLKQG